MSHTVGRVGDLVSVELRGGVSLTGYVFANAENILTLHTTDANTLRSDLQVINASHIQQMVVMETAGTTPVPQELPSFYHQDTVLPPPEDSTQHLRKLEERVAQQDRLVGEGVTREAQSIFEYLRENLDCGWDGDVIAVDGNVRLRPPYGPAEVEAPAGQERRQRRVVDLLEAR